VSSQIPQQPHHVGQYRDRHGKVRRYIRLPGRAKVPLPGTPGNEAFMDAYAAALASETPRGEIGATRTKSGTVDAAIVGLYGSTTLTNLAPSTQRMRRNVYERFAPSMVTSGSRCFSAGTSPMEWPRGWERLPLRAASWPSSARWMQYCQSIGMIDDDPTVGVKGVKIRTDGIYTWSEADIEMFEAKYPAGTRARLALALLLYTAQRRSDVIRMGRQHVRDGAIHLKQRKTGATLAIPVHTGRLITSPSWSLVMARLCRCRRRQSPSRVVQQGRIAETMLGVRAALGGVSTARRGRVLGPRDHGDQRPRRLAGSAAVLRRRRSGPHGALGDGQRYDGIWSETGTEIG
jgi:integrase